MTLIKVQYKRRRENKTDYVARRKMLEGDIPRIVIRKTNRYIIAELVKSKEAQDSVICSVNSKELIKYGWPNSFSIKNLPACYLTGFLLGKKIKEKNNEKAILDIGLIRSTKGNKIYAVLKGVLDAGINVAHSEEILPEEKRILGSHINEKIKDQFEKTKSGIGK